MRPCIIQEFFSFFDPYILTIYEFSWHEYETLCGTIAKCDSMVHGMDIPSL